MKDLAAGVSPEVKAAIIQEFLDRARNARRASFDGEECLREIEGRLRGEGVPEEFIQLMSARHRERALLRPTVALARALFPIERLPDGALPVYYREPDVAEEPSKE